MDYSSLPRTAFEAKALKQKFYFSGQPCPKGHVAPRTANRWQCVVCKQDLLVRWRKNHPYKHQQVTRNWCAKNPRRARALGNHVRALGRAKKRAPSWVDRAALRQIYLDCPEGWQVDHMVPLDSPVVSGLHVPWNLRYLTPKSNKQKGRALIF